jgi:hypothetical protein
VIMDTAPVIVDTSRVIMDTSPVIVDTSRVTLEVPIFTKLTSRVEIVRFYSCLRINFAVIQRTMIKSNM